MEACFKHQPIQHRDGKPPWCRECGLTSNFQVPVSIFDTRGQNLMDHQLKAKLAVVEAYNDPSKPTFSAFEARVGTGVEIDHVPAEITVDDVYVVWFAYTLGAWKCLISTTVPDDKYYEVTYNLGKKEMYVDTYVKSRNQVFTD